MTKIRQIFQSTKFVIKIFNFFLLQEWDSNPRYSPYESDKDDHSFTLHYNGVFDGIRIRIYREPQSRPEDLYGFRTQRSEWDSNP